MTYNGGGRKGRISKRRASWPENHRACTLCKKILPFECFGDHKNILFGKNPRCKLCRKPISKSHWEKWPIERKILYRAKKGAEKRNLEFNLTIEDIVIPEFCPILGKPLKQKTHDGHVADYFSPSIDRINSNKGYIKGNVQIISTRANLLKSNASLEEIEMLYNFLKKSL